MSHYMSECLSLLFFVFFLSDKNFSTELFIISLCNGHQTVGIPNLVVIMKSISLIQHMVLKFQRSRQDTFLGSWNFVQAETENATYLSQACAVCTLRLHINQVLVEVLELFHGGPEGHNLAGGVCRGVHLCSRHPAASPDITCGEKKQQHQLRFYNWLLNCNGDR